MTQRYDKIVIDAKITQNVVFSNFAISEMFSEKISDMLLRILLNETNDGPIESNWRNSMNMKVKVR